MRATKYKHYKNEANTSNEKSEPKPHKVGKKVKTLSFVFAVMLAAVSLIVPTTTLAPDVDAFEDSKAAAYSIGDVDAFSSLITDNCVPETTAATTAETTVAETTEETEATTEATEETQAVEEAETESTTEQETSEVAETAETVEYSDYVSEFSETSSSGSADYLIDISNPDANYSPSSVTLSDYDRAKLERLVMGEAGSMGYTGCALVAQSIRDAMNRSNTTSIDQIISEYQYYGSTSIEPNQTVKDAVAYIFDENGSAVQHRILCFYTGTSEWHESQTFIVGCGSVRFFDFK